VGKILYLIIILMSTKVFFSFQVSGAGYNDEGEVHIHKYESLERARESITALLEVGCVCNNAVIHDNQLLGQPTEGAMLAVAMKVLLKTTLFVLDF